MTRAKPAARKTCGSCMYLDDGACRRYPPQRVLTTREMTPPLAGGRDVDYTVWPVMRAEIDWCGEYKTKRGRAA